MREKYHCPITMIIIVRIKSILNNLNIDNKIPNPFFNLGHLFKEQGDLDKSIDYFNKCLIIDNKNYKAFHNRAVVKGLQNKYHEAINDFDEAIRIKSNYADAYFYKSIIQLQSGDYINGWKNYEWRWKIKNFSSPIRDFKKPYWDGNQSLNNKRERQQQMKKKII